MGGIGAAIDRADAAPEEILAYTKATLDDCCPGGHFIPSITYGLPGAVFPHIDRYVDQAIDAYNAQLRAPRFDLPPVPRRSVHAQPADSVRSGGEDTAAQGDILGSIAAAIRRGQQKKLLALIQEALQSGVDAQDILSGGLVRGMNELGEDFSASRAFVPEMLIAARCMTAATALLKPYMVDESGRPPAAPSARPASGQCGAICTTSARIW